LYCTRKVLIVEDNALLRGIYTDLVEEAGYEVRACSSAEGALEICIDRMPDAVVTDEQLAGALTGTELIAHLVGLASDTTKFILVSGITEAPHGLPKQATFLRKPFRAEQLLLMLDAL
jgi:sigma-B regulation protein RsbU (phosphoserine phosphatase)